MYACVWKHETKHKITHWVSNNAEKLLQCQFVKNNLHSCCFKNKKSLSFLYASLKAYVYEFWPPIIFLKRTAGNSLADSNWQNMSVHLHLTYILFSTEKNTVLKNIQNQVNTVGRYVKCKWSIRCASLFWHLLVALHSYKF